MKRKTRNNIFISALAGVIVCAGSATAYRAIVPAQGDALLTSDLLLPSEHIVTSAVVPEQNADFKGGLMLTTSSKDVVTYLKNDVSGELSLQFEPILENGVLAMKTIEVEFTDVNSQESFCVFLEYDSTVNVGVELAGQKAGLFYSSGKLSSMTSFCNADGVYTRFSDLRTTVTFDPDDMSVSVGDGESENYTVWSFLSEENDGRDIGAALNKFGEYRVSFRMADYIGLSASMILYSVNECSLDKAVLQDVGAPACYAPFKKMGLVGAEYVLPTGYGYDVLDGQLETEWEVFDPNGISVAKNQTSFKPLQTGEYTVKYTATNSLGTSGEKEYIIEVCEETPSYEYSLLGEFPSEVNVNENVYIPEMVLRGGLNLYGTEKASVSISRNGVELLVYQNVPSGFTYRFQYEGTYLITYHVGSEDVVFAVEAVSVPFAFSYAFADDYETGAYFDLTSSVFSVGGEELPFDINVTFPDGSVYANEKFLCSQAGLYTVEILSQDGRYTYQKSINVLEKSAEKFSTVTAGATIDYATSSFTGRSGIRITTNVNNTTIEYAEPISLDKYTGQSKVGGTPLFGETKTLLSETATPFIELSVEPYAYNTIGLGYITIVLTDAADPDNEIHISVNPGGSKTTSYVAAGAGNQGYAGYQNGRHLWSYSSAASMLYGAYINHSFGGVTPSSEPYPANESCIKLYYDNEEKQILTEPRQGTNCIVADFDNSDLSNGTPWSGFTSDQVYLSVIMGKLNKETGSCMIYSIDGASFATKYLEYDKAPEISVATESLEGLKGYTLSIPSVVAKDKYGSAIDDVQTFVYYVKNGKEYNVDIQDGRFSTEKAGEYRIRYYATDKYGNCTKKEIPVTVYENYAEMIANIDDPSFEYTTGKTGTSIGIYPTENISISNALGSVTTTVSVVYNGSDISVQGGSFVPERRGEYTVIYTLTDGVGRRTEVEYSVTVELEESPVLVSTLPQYVGFVRGNTYELFDVYVKDYTQENAETFDPILADIYINGEKYNADTYVPAALLEAEDAEEQNEILHLEYRYGNAVVASYDIPVRTVYKERSRPFAGGFITETTFRADRYFVAETGMSLQLMKGHLLMTSSEASATASFTEALPAQGLNFSFDIAATKNSDLSAVSNNVKSVSIRMTDVLDASKTLTVRIVLEDDGTTALYVGDKKGNEGLTGSLVGTALNAFQLRLDNAGKAVYDVSSTAKLIDLESYDDGRKFDGFGERVYVAFAVESNNAEAASVQLLALNGQTFTDGIADDMTAPTLTVQGAFEGIYLYQSTVTIPKASCNDVLSTIKKGSLCVTVVYVGENGNEEVRDVNGLPLTNVAADREYQVTLEKLGNYKIVYTVSDIRKGSSTVTYTFRSLVLQDPVITLSTEVPETAKLNEEIMLPEYSVAFVDESEENLSYVIYITPGGAYQLLKEKNSFVAQELGVYKIRYFALDSYGNYTISEYKIEVSNKEAE